MNTVLTMESGLIGVSFVGGQRQDAFLAATGLVGVGPGGHAGNALHGFTLCIFALMGTP